MDTAWGGPSEIPIRQGKRFLEPSSKLSAKRCSRRGGGADRDLCPRHDCAPLLGIAGGLTRGAQEDFRVPVPYFMSTSGFFAGYFWKVVMCSPRIFIIIGASHVLRITMGLLSLGSTYRLKARALSAFCTVP